MGNLLSECRVLTFHTSCLPIFDVGDVLVEMFDKAGCFITKGCTGDSEGVSFGDDGNPAGYFWECHLDERLLTSRGWTWERFADVTTVAASETARFKAKSSEMRQRRADLIALIEQSKEQIEEIERTYAASWEDLPEWSADIL